MPRMIYKCRAKACPNKWAFDYPEKNRYSLGYGRYATKYFRIAGDRRVEMGMDSKCGSCGVEHARGNMVKGFTTEHVCDDRCMSATGSNCECSCGGKNHGGSFLCVAA